MKWIRVSDRLPLIEETLDGRVPTIDTEGCLRYAMLIDNANQPPFLFSDTKVEYWIAVPQLTSPK